VKAISAPWRIKYVKSKKPAGCIFCKDSIRKDDMLLWEGRHAFVMMNRYPYTGGHMMVIPVRHVRGIEDLTRKERVAMFDLLDICIRVLKEAMNPEGFNIGMNLGTAAGAGVDDHLHIHIIPRWSGDTNFMSVVGEVRIINEDLVKTWKKLVPLFEKYLKEGIR